MFYCQKYDPYHKEPKQKLDHFVSHTRQHHVYPHKEMTDDTKSLSLIRVIAEITINVFSINGIIFTDLFTMFHLHSFILEPDNIAFPQVMQLFSSSIEGTKIKTSKPAFLKLSSAFLYG